MGKHINISLTLPKSDFSEIRINYKEEYQTFFENHEDGNTSILFVVYEGLMKNIEEIKFKLSILCEINQENISHFEFEEKDTKYTRIILKDYLMESRFDLLPEYCYNIELLNKIYCVKHLPLGYGTGLMRRYKGNCTIHPTTETH